VELDWGEVERAGLLADADDVEDRKELLRLLAKDGVTVEEMAAAQAQGALMRVVGERTIRPGAGTLTLREVATRSGVDPETVERILRSLGAISPDPDERTMGEDDVELVACALAVVECFGEQTGWGLLRRYGSLLERMTEATSAAVIREHPDISTVHSHSEAVTARTWSDVAEVVPRVGRLLDLAGRHQIEAVRRYFEEAGAGQPTQASFVLGVGFADLSGFTAASLLLDLQDLGGMVEAFEAHATEVVLDHGGRIVKFVGDAVLFVCNDPDGLATIGQELVAPVEGSSGLQARAGLARGPVLARDGDYFGPTVNLAARLVDVAEPGTVLAEGGLAAALDERRWSLTPQAPERLRGITEPVVPILLAQR
jgi:class 3 adenylate cyclase